VANSILLYVYALGELKNNISIRQRLEPKTALTLLSYAAFFFGTKSTQSCLLALLYKTNAAILAELERSPNRTTAVAMKNPNRTGNKKIIFFSIVVV
jgi:hypothetical protein